MKYLGRFCYFLWENKVKEGIIENLIVSANNIMDFKFAVSDKETGYIVDNIYETKEEAIKAISEVQNDT